MGAIQVRQGWSTYRRGIQAVIMAFNNPATMDSALGTIGPPPQDPGDWRDWLHALGMLVQLDTAVRVTNSAVVRMQMFIVAANAVAAAVRLPAPTGAEIDDLIANLRTVSEAIKQDQRFRAALAIAGKLADTIEAESKKP